MSVKSFVVIAGCAMLSIVGTPRGAAAQTTTQTPVQRAGKSGVPASHPSIEINPRRLLYRRCKDWYVIQHRPSGTVLFPQTHCWWVRG